MAGRGAGDGADVGRGGDCNHDDDVDDVYYDDDGDEAVARMIDGDDDDDDGDGDGDDDYRGDGADAGRGGD